MKKTVVITYVGGQEVDYLLHLLQRVAADRGVSFGYHRPHTPSVAACAERLTVRLGADNLCLEGCKLEGDVLLALEEMELRRGLPYLAKGKRVIVCNQHRLPMAVAVGTKSYPTDCMARTLAEGYPIWQVKRKEIAPSYVSALLLRALDLTKEQVATYVEDTDTVERAFCLNDYQ